LEIKPFLKGTAKVISFLKKIQAFLSEDFFIRMVDRFLSTKKLKK